jgi:hypothetical protein
MLATREMLTSTLLDFAEALPATVQSFQWFTSIAAALADIMPAIGVDLLAQAEEAAGIVGDDEGGANV